MLKNPEREGKHVTKFVDVSLGNLTIPFSFGRQDVGSNAMRAKLDGIALSGYRIIHPWSTTSDAGILKELSISAQNPIDRAPLYALAMVRSDDGFLKYHWLGKSLDNDNLKSISRAIVDPLVEDPLCDPIDIAIKALGGENAAYVGTIREWEVGELAAHLTIALAERGKIYPSPEEPDNRIEPRFRWPSDLARMFGTAYLLGEGKIKDDVGKQRAKKEMEQDLGIIVKTKDSAYPEKLSLVGQINDLAGSNVLEARYW